MKKEQVESKPVSTVAVDRLSFAKNLLTETPPEVETSKVRKELMAMAKLLKMDSKKHYIGSGNSTYYKNLDQCSDEELAVLVHAYVKTQAYYMEEFQDLNRSLRVVVRQAMWPW